AGMGIMLFSTVILLALLLVTLLRHEAIRGYGEPLFLTPDWARLLRCTECGARDAHFMVSGRSGSRERQGALKSRHKGVARPQSSFVPSTIAADRGSSQRRVAEIAFRARSESGRLLAAI